MLIYSIIFLSSQFDICYFEVNRTQGIMGGMKGTLRVLDILLQNLAHKISQYFLSFVFLILALPTVRPRFIM